MTTYERLENLRSFVYERLCKGRAMRTPSVETPWAEPGAFIGQYPVGESGQGFRRCAPSILIVPLPGSARTVEEPRPGREGEGRRENRGEGPKRPRELGKTLPVQFVFSVYDPDPREEEGEGHEPCGTQTLLTWMDELERVLLGTAEIGDLYAWEGSISGGLLRKAKERQKTDADILVDTRPVYVGVLNCTFGAMAHQSQIDDIRDMLE